MGRIVCEPGVGWACFYWQRFRVGADCITLRIVLAGDDLVDPSVDVLC